MSQESAWLFQLAPSGRTHIAELREFAEKLNPDLGPMFGRDVVQLVEEAERLQKSLGALRREFELRGQLGASAEDVAMYLKMAEEGLCGTG